MLVEGVEKWGGDGDLRVGALEQLFVAVERPGLGAHAYALGDVEAGNVDASLWDHAREGAGDGAVEAEDFLDGGVEEG